MPMALDDAFSRAVRSASLKIWSQLGVAAVGVSVALDEESAACVVPPPSAPRDTPFSRLPSAAALGATAVVDRRKVAKSWSLALSSQAATAADGEDGPVRSTP